MLILFRMLEIYNYCKATPGTKTGTLQNNRTMALDLDVEVLIPIIAALHSVANHPCPRRPNHLWKAELKSSGPWTRPPLAPAWPEIFCLWNVEEQRAALPESSMHWERVCLTAGNVNQAPCGRPNAGPRLHDQDKNPGQECTHTGCDIPGRWIDGSMDGWIFL